MGFVCPQPIAWNKIYDTLMAVWQAKGEYGNPPPNPLILNDYDFSTDSDKYKRWLDIIKWAKEHDVEHLIPELEGEECYTADEDYAAGGYFYYVGPDYGEQYHEPKYKPSESEVSSALNILKTDWLNIVGDEIGSKTYPYKFTGKKRRRLLVFADPTYRPAWELWNWYGSPSEMLSFSKFRVAINKAISPLSVDHIDFIERWNNNP